MIAVCNCIVNFLEKNDDSIQQLHRTACGSCKLRHLHNRPTLPSFRSMSLRVIGLAHQSHRRNVAQTSIAGQTRLDRFQNWSRTHDMKIHGVFETTLGCFALIMTCPLTSLDMFCVFASSLLQGVSAEVDNGVTCGNCMALVLAEKYGGRCDRYCESFGQVCIKAAEEQEENCEVKYEVPCNQAITGTSDILCQCGKRNAPPQCPAPPATTQTTTPTPSPNKRIQVVGHKAAPIFSDVPSVFF